MEGRLLGGRYELIQKIGGGGMAQVYKAKDQLLGRYVAVKILRNEFIDDDEFLKRFKVEAQSSAGLQHPNIVSIYDVGQDGDIQYIVMECIEGITLKELIIKTGFLQWEEAMKIAIQICSALEHAHRNHIIHRDIKPQNILIMDNGVAKVTDFGIARAVSSSTITTAGNTIGSVHYFSPEQARGGFIDEKADIYSIGITIYEMVTGKMPFDGDTPVSIALKHIQDAPVPPKDLNPVIPDGVNDIILKAIQKDQNSRYQKATELLEDLNLVLMSPDDLFVEIERETSNSTKRIKAVSDKSIAENSDMLKEKGGIKALLKKEKLKYWLVGGGAIIFMALILFLSYWFITNFILQGTSEYIVEDFVGKEIGEVQTKLMNENILYNVKFENSSKIDKDIIITQNKEAGYKLKRNGFEKIEFVVSSGPKLIIMPDYSDKDPRIVKKDLMDLGVKESNITEIKVFSDEIEKGLVVDTTPLFGTEFVSNDKITINISKGPEIVEVEVPNLKGKTLAQAKKLLKDANLAVGTVTPKNSSDYIDKVVDQNPAAGTTVEEGQSVNISLQEKQKIVTWTVKLTNPGDFTDPMHVKLVITPSDTGVEQIRYNETRNKSDFPLYFSIPVPANGSTLAQVYIDDVLYSTVTMK